MNSRPAALNSDEIKTLVANGESFTLELKPGIPRPELMAQHIAAFSNASGGTLLLGVRGPKEFIGIDKEKARRAVEQSTKMLFPAQKVSLEFPQVDGKTIGAVRVPSASTAPISAQGALLRRANGQLVPLTTDEIRQQVLRHKSPDQALADLAAIITQQSKEIELLRADFRREHSLARKLCIAGIGTAFGALLREIIQHFL